MPNAILTEKPSTPVAAPQAPAKTHRPWWQVTAATVALLGAAVIGVEGLFAFAGVGMEEILQPDPEYGTKHIPNKLVVWRMEGYSSDKLNSQGLRDVEHPIAKPEGVFRIALLGDSATEGLQVPLKGTYGRQLEDALKQQGRNIEVINFGCSGYSTGQEVMVYERQVAQYKPDLVILLYNRGDAVENLRSRKDLRVEPRPYFYVDEKGHAQRDDVILTLNKDRLQPNQTLEWLRLNSSIFGVICHSDLTLNLNEWLYRKIRRWTQQANEAWTKVVAASHPGKKLPSGIPTYPPQDAWIVTGALLEQLAEGCRQNQSKLLVITFPNSVNDPEYDVQIKKLGQLAQKEKFDTFDLTPVFYYDNDPLSLYLKYHFSAKGHQVVAEQIEKYLKAH